MEEAIIPVLIPLSIIMIIIYFKIQRLFTLAFSISAITYVLTIFYVIYRFDLGGGLIFLLLLFSAILMVGIGIYIKHLKNAKKKR